MTVPIAWVSYHEPDIIRRGYWDQGLLERTIDRSLHRPVQPVPYSHHDGIETLPAGAEGAVVVVPAQHHAGAEDLSRLNAEIANLGWVLVILTGDECSLFPWQDLQHPALRLWVMTPHPEHHAECPARFIGEGWRYDTPEVLAETSAAKDQDWFFAGQVTHRRRKALAAALRRLSAQSGRLVETPGFTQGMERRDYLRALARAKVAPCPAGACTPDSFRLYEALEAGCLPLLDDTSPKGWSGFWALMERSGARPPAPTVERWADVGTVIDSEVGDQWPANANRASAWWQGYKRSLAYALDDDVREVSGEEFRSPPTPSAGLADLVTVLMPTSPIPSHPATAVITETLGSVMAHPQLAGCEAFVMIDGVRPEQEHRRGDYEEYQRRLLQLTNTIPGVVPLRFEDHTHQAKMTRQALEQVRTPLVLFVEHDTPLVGEIPFVGLAQVILDGTAEVVRLHHEAEVLKPHRYLMADDSPVDVAGVPMQRTAQWSQRPHLASADWYRAMLDKYFGPNARTMIEDRLYGEIATPWVERREWGKECRLWLYAPAGDMKRSTHLDGRGEDPKYEMTW